MMPCVFSTTTMASSTREPMTRIRPNMVRVLMLYPRAYMTLKVPTSDTGMATAGMSVARQSWMNSHVTRTTRIRATTRVETISRMEATMNLVGS